MRAVMRPSESTHKFVGRELPPAHIGGACGRLAALRGRLLARQRPYVLCIPFGKQTVDRGERPQRVVERHTTHVARDLAVVQRFGDDDVARRETCDLLRHIDQTFAAQVVAQRRVGGRVGDVGIGRRNRRRCRRKDREDVARRGHVQPILAAEKAYQIVHTGPAEVARHGDVLHAAHRHVHAAGARDMRSSSDSDNRPDVTSTSRRNVESRPTSAANSESIRDRRKESGSDGGFGATVRWSESEDGFTPAGISARCAGQSTGRMQRSKNASVYRRFIGLDQ